MKRLAVVLIERCPLLWPIAMTFYRCFAARPETEDDVVA